MAVPMSLLVASFAELTDAISLEFSFPVIAIPFGADETVPCRFFGSSDEVSAEHVAGLLRDSYPMRDGVRRIHVLSVSKAGISHFSPAPVFFLAPS